MVVFVLLIGHLLVITHLVKVVWVWRAVIMDERDDSFNALLLKSVGSLSAQEIARRRSFFALGETSKHSL
jgi:hypothetical protein